MDLEKTNTINVPRPHRRPGYNAKKIQADKSDPGILADAKNEEWRELAEGIEKKINERTRELQKRIDESENSRVALMNMLEDMDDLRRKTEEEKEKTLAIITNFADGLMLFDSYDRLTLVNPQMELYFGAAKEDAQRIIGKKIADFKNAASFSPLADFFDGNLQKIFRKELFLGEKAIFEVSSFDVAGRFGKIGMVIIVHDITREKMVEKMKTEFVSIAAHQLRTPISAIKWTLRMILDGDLGQINNEQREFLEKTYKSNERMINLINDLLNVTRIEEGRHLYNIVVADMVSIVGGLVGNYNDIARQKNIGIFYENQVKGTLPARVDVEKIKLVISNLVENAIKYTSAGGKINVILADTGSAVQVTVRDTGMGILKNQYDRIFTKYFRGANAIKMETEGTGLGLFIAKNIVETHGGKIWFESEENKGAIFCFSIPRV